MTTKSVPLQRATSLGGGKAHFAETAEARSPRRASSSGKPAPRRVRLARRLSSGLLRRLPSFAPSVTDSDASDEESRRDGPPSVGGLEPVAAPSENVAGDAACTDALAREVGRNALAYLEECFGVATSVSDRHFFDAIPEIVPEALEIADHIGKGSYCDVFDVVYKGSQHARLETGETYALKRLRPQLRSVPALFTMGAEDLVHETAVLANLSHPHVIELFGRAHGQLADAFVLHDGYFLLLERLQETLLDRLEEWRNADGVKKGPGEEQLRVARDVADAMVYLHSKKVIFRDLKPDNVGFDGRGVLKLFDFGFATDLPDRDVDNPGGHLFDRCGTPRYMAPEVGLSQGYGLPSDVYSFGILLWEVCALATPFAAIATVDEFEGKVFAGGARPRVGGRWPRSAKALMRRCWTTWPGSRPSMLEVSSSLAEGVEGGGEGSAMKTLRSNMTKSMKRGLSM